MRQLIACCLAMFALGHTALAADFPRSALIFGYQPKQKILLLGLDHSSIPPTPIKLVCIFYPNVMVEQLFNADEGAEIALAPAGTPCEPPKATSAITLNSVQFPASFWGVIGRYAFIIGIDGLNAGEPFVVMNLKTHKVVAENIAYPAPAHARLIPGGLTFDFTAQLDLQCSVLAPGHTCAASVQKQTGDPVHIPLCLHQYQPAQAAIDAQCRAKNAPAWCGTSSADIRTDPSVINYPARMTILNDAVRTIATGPISDCFASE